MLRIAIPGVTGYMVDETGQVWSVKSGRSDRWSEPHMIKPWIDKRGYHHVTLRPSELLCNKKRYSVHVLMMLAFVGERPGKATVAHLDGNPSNNSISNLAYMAHADNINHRWRHNTMIHGDKSHLSKVSDEVAKEIWEALQNGASNKEIMVRFGVSESYPAAMKAGRMRKGLTGIAMPDQVMH